MCCPCKKPGHLVSGCWSLKEESQAQKTPVGLVKSKERELAIEELVLVPKESVSEDNVTC